MIRVTVWNEHRHEQQDPAIAAVYPQGIHGQIASFLQNELRSPEMRRLMQLPGMRVRDAYRLAHYDENLRTAAQAVEQGVVERIQQRVLKGMGLIVLHSGHMSKIFKKLMGTSCDLKWREAEEQERIFVIDPTHDIVKGIPESFMLEKEEMYGEHFDIPAPDETLLLSWFAGGNVFRSGITYKRGNGRIFYFQPGHESYPTYYHPHIQTIICNGVTYCAPRGNSYPVYGNEKNIYPITGAII